jgi:hypothetical protein
VVDLEQIGEGSTDLLYGRDRDNTSARNSFKAIAK